jgi:selenocysteine lyase/cysteine desulfurase
MDGRRRFLKKMLAGASLGALSLTPFSLLKAEQNDPEIPVFQPNGLSEKDLWAEVRKQFTFYEDQIYFNSATFGLMPKPVMQAIAESYKVLATGKYNVSEEPRDKVASFLNAKPKEVALTHNTTEGINIVAAGLPLRRRDEVIMSDQEHVGNGLPWLNRARRDGIRIKVFSPGSTAAETLQRINDLVTRRTRAVAVPHLTCTTGQVLPAKDICTLARDKGFYSFIDGAHGPGTMPLDMRDMGCDFYATCGHKWLCGPPGTGFLYVKESRLPELETIMVGAYSDTGWNISKEGTSLDPLVKTAHRFDYGTQNNAQRIGLMAAVEFMESIGWDKVHGRIRELAGYLQTSLMQLPHVEMLTPTEEVSRASIVGFQIPGRSMAYFRTLPPMAKIRIRLVPESGLNSIRISTHIFNTKEEIDHLVEVMGSAKP